MQFRGHRPMSALRPASPVARIPRAPGDPRRPSARRAAALLSLFILTVAGCGGSDSDTGPAATATATDAATDAATDTATDTATDSAPATTPAPTETNEPAAVDSCTLLSDDEAAQFLGGPVVSSGPTSGVGESVCQWASEQGWSIDVAVGSPGTAPGNSFVPDNLFGVEPKPIPALGGSGWDIGLGTVDFAAGERRNSVLVVSSASSETNAQTAAAVALLVRDRIEAAS